MGKTEALKSRIIQDAREEADRIIQEAERQADQIIKEAESKGEERKKELIREGQKKAEDIKHQEKILAGLERRKKVLAAKQEEIKKVFKEVLTRVGEIEETAYREIIEEMLIREVQSGEEKVAVSRKDRERLGEDFLESVNKRLEEEGRTGSLTFSESSRDISGGFILLEEGVENNNSFDEILKMNLDELEPLAAQILFSEE